MDQPLLLMFGMIVISTLLFVLSRNFCRDPEMIHAEVEREQQRVLAEAMVRNMDTHELVAIASGRVSAGLTGAGGSQRSRAAIGGEQRAGINEETRMSFVKLSAGRGGHTPEIAPSHGAGVCGDGESFPARDARPMSSSRFGSAERSGNAPLVSSSVAQSEVLPSRQRHSVIAEPEGPPSAGMFPVGREEAAKDAEPMEAVAEPIEVPPGAYSDNSCSICLDDYEEGDQLLQLTCGHVFHRPCIDLWLKSHCVCPCCRTDLDQLAQVAQVFPTRGRRSLQKALSRAEGNIAAAVELLLTQNRSGEAIDGEGVMPGLVDGREASRPSQTPDRVIGTRRVSVGDSVGGRGSPFGRRNGTLVGESVGGDGYTSGATLSDGGRTRDAFRRRAESRPGSSVADALRHSFRRTLSREAERENATNVSTFSQAPLATVMENSTGETSTDGNRPRQAVETVISGAAQSQSLTEPSSEGTDSRQELGNATEIPPPVRVGGEARASMGARGRGSVGLPRPSAIMRVGKRYPPAAVNASPVDDAQVTPSATDERASGTPRSSAPPSYAEAMSEIAPRRPVVISRAGSSTFGGEEVTGGESSVVALDEASVARGEDVTSPAEESRVSAE